MGWIGTIHVALCVSLRFVSLDSIPVAVADQCSLAVQTPFYTHISYHSVDPACARGTVYWSYPSGNIVVDFRYRTPDKAFLVCMQIKKDPADIRYFDVTEGMNDDKRRQIPLPGEGNYACVPDFNGLVSIQLEAPFFPLTYFHVLEYRLIFDWKPVSQLETATVAPAS